MQNSWPNVPLRFRGDMIASQGAGFELLFGHITVSFAEYLLDGGPYGSFMDLVGKSRLKTRFYAPVQTGDS